ncbi:hypothetical protein [Methylomonas sp. LWB]|uniref:hypothetical protein n=1 Tax=Methylomonas sp. LWB TaxID=1905845 RepID=UPI0011150E4F|nr:hypothetical protein [Methylomonas sp. LWB]
MAERRHSIFGGQKGGAGYLLKVHASPLSRFCGLVGGDFDRGTDQQAWVESRGVGEEGFNLDFFGGEVGNLLLESLDRGTRIIENFVDFDLVESLFFKLRRFFEVRLFGVVLVCLRRFNIGADPEQAA